MKLTNKSGPAATDIARGPEHGGKSMPARNDTAADGQSVSRKNCTVCGPRPRTHRSAYSVPKEPAATIAPRERELRSRLES